jgi:hypothetical protein
LVMTVLSNRLRRGSMVVHSSLIQVGALRILVARGVWADAAWIIR